MTDVVLSPISSGYNLSIINANFTKVQQKINEEMLHLTGGNNTMLQQLDMNNNKLINVFTDPNDPNSLVTIGAGDSRWYNVAGDTLTGTMNVGYQRIINLPVPVGATEPVRKGEYDSQAADLVNTIIANKLQSVRGQDGEQLTPLPPAGSRANKVMGFDALGNPLGILPASGSGTELAIDLADGVTIGKGASLVAYDSTTSVKTELSKTVKSASLFFASTTIFPLGSRVSARSGEVWDIVAGGTGEFNHPITGQGLIPVPTPNGDMVARSYNVHRANTGAANLTGIQLALNRLSVNGAGMLELPFGSVTEPIVVSGKIDIPENVGLRGSAWNKCVISFDTINGGVTWGSGSILEDVDLRGNGVAEIGLIERTEFNRVAGRRVRIQDFTKWGAAFGMVGAANNSLLEDFQVKFCGEVNLALCQTLNCTFMNFNSDLSTPSTATARGIKIFDLYPSGTSNQQCRNTRFIGGIHERGSSDYQIEIERATQLTFIGTEFNNGSIATCKVSKGGVNFITPHATLNGTNKFLEVAAGADVRVYSPNITGTEGRALSELISGPVRVDGTMGFKTMGVNLRAYLPVVSGVATATTDPILGAQIISASGGGANRAQISNPNGYTVTGKPRGFKVEIMVSVITSGTVQAYLQLATTPFRLLLGTLAVGLNTFSVVTDQSTNGSLDILGLAGFDITLLTAETSSF